MAADNSVKISGVSVADWELRLANAKVLSAAGKECAVCGGTGGWPGLHEFVICRPCSGMGEELRKSK